MLLHYCTVCTILLNLVGHDRMLLAEKAVAGMLPARIGALARACSAVQCRIAASPLGTTARVSAPRVPYGSYAIALALVDFGDAVASGVSKPGALLSGDAGGSSAVAFFLFDGGIGAGELKKKEERAVRPRLCCDEA